MELTDCMFFSTKILFFLSGILRSNQYIVHNIHYILTGKARQESSLFYFLLNALELITLFFNPGKARQNDPYNTISVLVQNTLPLVWEIKIILVLVIQHRALIEYPILPNSGKAFPFYLLLSFPL